MREEHEGIEFSVRSLGPLEAKLVLSLTEAGLDRVTVQEAADILGDIGSARSALRRLHKKGWLERLVAGRYLLHGPEAGYLSASSASTLVFASGLLEPSYVGWFAAARYHSFTTQYPFVVRVAALRQATPRQYGDAQIHIVKVVQRKFFGYQEAKLGRSMFTVSTPEKTIVDCVDRPEFCGGPIETAIIVARGLDKASIDGVIEDSIRNGSVATIQRLGFLLDVTRPDLFHAEKRRLLLDKIPSSVRSVFGRKEREEGDVGYVPEWRLQVNVREAELMAELGAWARPGAGTWHSSMKRDSF